MRKSQIVNALVAPAMLAGMMIALPTYAQQEGTIVLAEGACDSFIACAAGLVVVSEFFKDRPFGDHGAIFEALDVHPSEWGRCGVGGCSDQSVMNQVGRAIGDVFGW